jgi:chitinase
MTNRINQESAKASSVRREIAEVDFQDIDADIEESDLQVSNYEDNQNRKCAGLLGRFA